MCMTVTREMRIVTNAQKVRYVWILVLRRSCLSFPSQANYGRTELLPSVSEAIVQMALTKKREARIVFNWACFYWYIFASLLPQCVLGVCWTTMLKVCHRGTIWIRQWHWTTITTVGCLLLFPQHIGPTSGCCKFITPNTLAIPPNRVKS